MDKKKFINDWNLEQDKEELLEIGDCISYFFATEKPKYILSQNIKYTLSFTIQIFEKLHSKEFTFNEIEYALLEMSKDLLDKLKNNRSQMFLHFSKSVNMRLVISIDDRDIITVHNATIMKS